MNFCSFYLALIVCSISNMYHIHLRLAPNSLYTRGGPWADVPASTFPVLKLWLFDTTQFYPLLKTKPRASCILDKHSINWTMLPTYMLFIFPFLLILCVFHIIHPVPNIFLLTLQLPQKNKIKFKSKRTLYI